MQNTIKIGTPAKTPKSSSKEEKKRLSLWLKEREAFRPTIMLQLKPRITDS